MKKITVATDWLDGCSGCHMSFLDMDEKLVELIKLGVELTATPITDLKEPPEEGVDIGILEGAISTNHHIEVAKKMRERCKILIAIGDCAVFGGIVTMRNYFSVENLLKRGYIETESTVDGKIPTSPEIGKHIRLAKAVNGIVRVDYYIPGCPPRAEAIYYTLKELVEGRKPVLTGELLRYD
jgi:NAD-reducing hydrogenase small subunit